MLKAIAKLNEDQTDTKHYTYRVSWSREDGEYVATIVEFPSLSWLHDRPTAKTLEAFRITDISCELWRAPLRREARPAVGLSPGLSQPVRWSARL